MGKDCIATRWIMAILGCLGLVIVYGLKVNLSVAIIAMLNHTAVVEMSAGGHDHAHDDHGAVELNGTETEEIVSGTLDANSTAGLVCESHGEKSSLVDGPFAWDENIQGFILGSYFYGYIVTQVPGGWVAEKFSAKQVFGVGVLLNAILTLLSPISADASWMWLVVMRIGMGIAAGVTLPSMHCLIASWAPPQERSKIASTVYAGMTLGTLIALPFTGFLAAEFGWASVFYIQGGLSLLWYILWLYFVYDSPDQHPRISTEEKTLIKSSMGIMTGKHERMSVPWKHVWTSLPVWAIIIAHTCSNWGWYMLLVKLPTYMRYILLFDIKSNAMLSAVPFLCMWIFTMVMANVLDALRSRNIISTSIARKFSTLIASVLPGILLVSVTYVGCNTTLAVVLLTLGAMFLGGMYSGFLSNHIDIAPTFAGTLMGITNTFATIPGIVMPSIIGIITHGNQTIEAWRFIFYITLAIFATEAVVFTLFGSGEIQEWAKPKRVQPEQQKLYNPNNRV